MESLRRREQSRDGGVGLRSGEGSGSGEGGSFLPGDRARTGRMSRASKMLERWQKISLSAQ